MDFFGCQNKHQKAATSTSLFFSHCFGISAAFLVRAERNVLQCTQVLSVPKVYGITERKKKSVHPSRILFFAFGHSSRDAELVSVSTHQVSDTVACLTRVLRCFWSLPARHLASIRRILSSKFDSAHFAIASSRHLSSDSDPGFCPRQTSFPPLCFKCREIGKELAKLHNLAVVTGGFFGAPDVVARTFHECRVNNGQTDPRVFHILPKRDDKVNRPSAPASFRVSNRSLSIADLHWQSAAEQRRIIRGSELREKLVPWKLCQRARMCCGTRF